MFPSELFTAKKSKISGLRALIDKELEEVNQELLLVIESKTAEITKLSFEKERLEKKLAELTGNPVTGENKSHA